MLSGNKKRIAAILMMLVMVITFAGKNDISRASESMQEETEAEASEEITGEEAEDVTEDVSETVTEETEEASEEVTEETVTEASEEAEAAEEETGVSEVLEELTEITEEVLYLAATYEVLSHLNISNDSGASCGYFEITNVSGYAVCGNQNISGPSAGSTANNAEDFTGQVYRDLFYYGYGGPGAGELSINNNMGNGIVALSKAISYYSMGDAGLSGSTGGSGMHHECKTLYDYAVSDDHNAPSASLTFSKTSGVSVSVTNGVQKTENITLNGDSRMSYNIPLETGMSLYKSDGTLVASSSSARVYGGTTFYITAPVTKNGTWSTGTLTSNEQTIGTVTRLDFGASAQPVWFANPTRATSSLSVTFSAPCAVELTKTSANAAVTNGNSCYSLENAVYGVYASQADAQADAADASGNLTANNARLAAITTNASGYGKAENLAYPAGGSYYVKELVAPKGYALDYTVYSVSATAGGTATVMNVTDIPQLDPAAILVKKEGSTNIPLAGAEFTVKYYDVQMNTDPALSGYSPERTWVLRTNEIGVAVLRDADKVSGDDFYYTQFGDPALPVGTVTIQETKAPAGYFIEETAYADMKLASDHREDVPNSASDHIENLSENKKAVYDHKVPETTGHKKHAGKVHHRRCKKVHHNNNINIYTKSNISNQSKNEDKIKHTSEKIINDFALQVDYDALAADEPDNAYLPLLLDAAADALSSTEDVIRCAGSERCSSDVKQRLNSVNFMHVKYILECIRGTSAPIRNPKAYLLTCLYNAPVTMEAYYEQQAKSALASGGWTVKLQPEASNIMNEWEDLFQSELIVKNR